MRVDLVPYDATWPQQFAEIGSRLRAAFGDRALFVHHIGSTGVPGLAAKDVIDVQVTVADLTEVDPLGDVLETHGFLLRPGKTSDHPPPWRGSAEDWTKRYLRETDGGRRTHVHVRELGRPNQRYAV